MNMKSILTYLAVLTLSFNAAAVQVQDEPTTAASNNLELSQISSPDTHLATQIVSSHSIGEAAEKPDEFMTALIVYLVIILVYTIYGIKVHSENIRD